MSISPPYDLSSEERIQQSSQRRVIGTSRKRVCRSSAEFWTIGLLRSGPGFLGTDND
ncbi:hypothetical protein SCHPADRAFT_909085 [Schizopora paradoxa]|uniref:Uncharacterized protein n=1 Tax=Schizopora paradoxa TaxID=27342 RepID=A0A0H2R8Z8_9AGAM|nr:hypothetical protein SCHPADRAFT_909085 [Schizopora paradoxa]